MPRFELTKPNGATFFWEIARDGTVLTTRFGKVGKDAEPRDRELPTLVAAKKEYARLVAEKKRVGYVEVASGQVSGFASNPELEGKIAANPEIEENYLVYADWLSARGDPRGELIASQHAGADEQAQRVIDENYHLFFRGIEQHAEGFHLEWRLGFVRGCILSLDARRSDYAEDIVDKILDVPTFSMLEALTITLESSRADELSLQPVVDVLAEKAPPTLRALHFDTPESLGMMTDFGRFEPVTQRLTGLRELRLCGGYVELGKLDLPNLRTLHLDIRDFRRELLETVIAGNLPMLFSLTLVFGDGGQPWFRTQLQTLLDRDLPHLRHLALRNHHATDDLAIVLTEGRLTKQLTSIDLSMGTLGENGVQQLLAWKTHFESLEILDVSDNTLGTVERVRIQDLCDKVITGRQRPPGSGFSRQGYYDNVME